MCHPDFPNSVPKEKATVTLFHSRFDVYPFID